MKRLLTWKPSLLMATLYGLFGTFFTTVLAYPASGPFTIAASRAEVDIVIDGKLDEEAWAQAPEAADFIQFVPDNGKPSSYETVAKVLYDDQYFYVGWLVYDPNPELIQLGNGKRDGLSSRSGTDSVTLMIDTFDDDQSCYYLRTNIQGVQHDGRMTDNGASPDDKWDGVWKSAGDYFDGGWVAEMAIPLETIQFQPGQDRTWGIQFARYFPRNREQSFWTGPLENYRRVSVFGSVTGLNLERSSKNLELVPYVSSKFQEEEDPGIAVGLDTRYRFSQGVSGILTVESRLRHRRGGSRASQLDPLRDQSSREEEVFSRRHPALSAKDTALLLTPDRRHLRWCQGVR